MRFQRLRKVLRWTLRAILALAVLLILFILEENIRGHILLARYKAELRAKGEKLTLEELDLPKLGTETNHAAALLAIANRLEGDRSRSRETGSIAEGLAFVGPNSAFVIHKQQGPVGHTYPTGLLKPADSWDEVSETMAAADGALKQAQEVLRQGPVEFDLDYAAGPALHLPHVNLVRHLNEWFRTSALLKLHNGDIDGALDCLQSMRTLTDSLADERVQICQVVRTSVQTTVLNTAWEFVQAENITDSELERLQRICALSDVTGDVIHALEVQVIFNRVYFRDARNASWTAGLWENLKFAFSPEGGWGVLRLLPETFMWKLAWLDQDERKALELQYAALGQVRKDLDAGCWVKARVHLPEDSFHRPLSCFYDHWRYMLSSIDVNTTWRITVLRSFQLQTLRELTLGAIALKRYHLRYHEFPADLGALVPTYLPQPPHDYMDGNRLRYRPDPAGAFTLYSVGDDCEDNGGDPKPLKSQRPKYSIWQGRDAVWPQPATER